MKFELKPYNKNVSDETLLNDLKRIADELQIDSLSIEEYDRKGKYHSSTIRRRFGSWTKTLKLAGLRPRKNPRLNADELLDDMRRVANILNKKSVTRHEYKSLGKYDTTPFVRIFGSWFMALAKAGLEKTRTFGITNEEYFKNLEEIWIKLGRQPNYAEIQKPFSKYSAGAYERRFGSWRKSLEAFIEYINECENIPLEKDEIIKPTIAKSGGDTQILKHKTNRNINWRLRFVILKRDNFKCKTCGRSPATDPSIILHVDHKTAWTNGGETMLENLETLCSKCNIGKSNLE